ncbi:MAG TPA: dephospho-CoA kinase [Methylomirabilota bacterium]|nr:dephospho-CoA kinase [Methylomirabilota bacterium]
MRERPLRIGITGPIGCGKSTVARWLGERQGVVVIDADVVARDVLAPGTLEVEAVYERFGEDLRGPDGGLDRSALGRIVFADPAALRDLEAIVHPAVRPRILALLEEAADSGATAVVIEAIKLVEGGLAKLCDEIWLVTCDPAVQLERLVGRGTARDDASGRIAAQGDLAGRLRHAATHVIETDGTLANTRSQVLERLDAALETA